MVSSPKRDERGQLLLVGAIGIALVIVGTVVLVNGLAFDDSISTRSNDDALGGAERTVQMIETDLNALARKVRADVEAGGGNFTKAFRENVSLYSRHYTNLSFDNGIVYTNVTFDGSESVGGTLLRQRLDNNGDAQPLRDGNNNNNELEVARNATSFTPFNLTIHEFACTIPQNHNSTIRFEENGSSEYWEIRLTRENCGTGTRYIEIYDSTRQIESVNSNDDDLSGSGNVAINISDGDLHIGDDIEFEFAPGLSPPYDISIESTDRGNAGTGTYRIRTDSSYPAPEPGEKPEISSIVYSPAVDIYYQRRDVVYNRTVVLNGTGAR